jgi:hypothetical protein
MLPEASPSADEGGESDTARQRPDAPLANSRRPLAGLREIFYRVECSCFVSAGHIFPCHHVFVVGDHRLLAGDFVRVEHGRARENVAPAKPELADLAISAHRSASRPIVAIARSEAGVDLFDEIRVYHVFDLR